jgi:type I restriction enzyme R subunit
MNWAKSDNTLIKDLKDFTATFFQKNTLLNVLLHYSVSDPLTLSGEKRWYSFMV